jgi:type IV pilus assembly protein PilQ
VEQLRTLTRQISYARGEDIVRLLKDTRVISKYGQAQLDARTNTVIITDIAAQLPQAQALIDTLDKPQPQVEIEARIVTTSKTFARALGIQWGFQGRVDPTLGNTTNLAFPNSGRIGGQGAGGVQAPPGGTVVNLPVAGAPTAIGLALGAINGAFNLDVALTAAESTGNVHIISSPRVSTTNNNEAEITQGTQIPIQTIANNTITVTFKDAALTLKVTPQITSSDTVIMQISVDNGSVGSVINGIPSINTQRANTTVQVNDGQTTVIGGIYASQENATTDRTPGLSRVPLLKWLFKRDRVDDQSSELLIFITPRIIKG